MSPAGFSWKFAVGEGETCEDSYNIFEIRAHDTKTLHSGRLLALPGSSDRLLYSFRFPDGGSQHFTDVLMEKNQEYTGGSFVGCDP